MQWGPTVFRTGINVGASRQQQPYILRRPILGKEMQWYAAKIVFRIWIRPSGKESGNTVADVVPVADGLET